MIHIPYAGRSVFRPKYDVQNMNGIRPPAFFFTA